MKTGANNFLKTQLFQLKIAFFSKKLSHHHQLHFLQSIISFVMFHPASQSFLLQFILMYVYVSSYFLQLIVQHLFYLPYSWTYLYSYIYHIWCCTHISLIFHFHFQTILKKGCQETGLPQGNLEILQKCHHSHVTTVK